MLLPQHRAAAEERRTAQGAFQPGGHHDPQKDPAQRAAARAGDTASARSRRGGARAACAARAPGDRPTAPASSTAPTTSRCSGRTRAWPATGRSAASRTTGCSSPRSKAAGLDYTSTVDGRGFKYLYFGAPSGYRTFRRAVEKIKVQAGLKQSRGFREESSLDTITSEVLGGGLGGNRANRAGGGRGDSGTGRSDLFRRTVDHLLVPYARVLGAQGYHFDPNLYASCYGLSPGQAEIVRTRLCPRGDARGHGERRGGEQGHDREGRGRTATGCRAALSAPL
ncbi:MAG: hypothetical protein H6Q86_5796 [candidate division NC10 bacterium]|nr:hypothetical protein [candidate division NC10 bacterium]